MALALQGEGFEGALECRGVFSSGYLVRHFKAAPEFAALDETRRAYDSVAALWKQTARSLPRRNEAFTCSAFLEPVMELLGWRRIPQAAMPATGFGTRKRPDYCLFSDEQDFNAAANGDAGLLFAHSATVLEAKRAGHPLDRVSDEETPGWFPSQQVQDYLHHARDATGRRFFNWAILTNGVEWRLYTEHSAMGAHFAFHLIRADQLCNLEDFGFFLSLFRAVSFEQTDGTCLLDRVHGESLRLQSDLELNLRKRIFNALEDLGTAFVAYPDNHLGEADFPAVYDNALILLYRLLFVLYAESRGLLPVKPYGAGANRRYLTQFSLARLVDRLRDRTAFDSDAFSDLYEQIQRLFHLINGTRAQQNRECEVTRYNGGLFNPDLHPRLEDWRIGDHSLANVLRQLMFAQPPPRPNLRQLEFATDEAIDYSTLEVRQLGDIYEGLLGARFERVEQRLELRDENGENHRHGIFYTPDWIVQYLVRETLSPLLAEIEASPEVQRALASAEDSVERRDNSFAELGLRLNIVDPAMGSGHFLVRATEWLADRIMRHPTTQTMTMQVIATGERRISREEIVAQGKTPVSPGMSQEQAELAYWRRRVVEACIYGVDINPMAVELAKLSLWLTCIAGDEPLNFLDHHLRPGNALLSVSPEELKRAPVPADAAAPGVFELGNRLQDVLGQFIREAMVIESTASDRVEVVKAKEGRWRDARNRLEPFIELAGIWLAGLDGAPVNELDYLSFARFLIEPHSMPAAERREVRRRLGEMAAELGTRLRNLAPFHWALEFPDVFFGEDGERQAGGRAGFDAVLGNPPYISTHTSSTELWRSALQLRTGWLEDLYVHFTHLGFSILRPGGGFGFIVSDTFFTLASKQPMREWLQSHALTHLGQCDPFDATVDAAIFVARKADPLPTDAPVLFVQARPLSRADGSKTKPVAALPLLPARDAIPWPRDVLTNAAPERTERHAEFHELRIHEAPLSLYANAHKRAFFEPRPCTLALYDRFNEPVKRLVDEWWRKIEDSRTFAANIGELRDYHRTLKPGDVTLVGLIAEGGQGMRTANNARFIAYLEGTAQALEIERQSTEWSARWLADARIGPRFRELLTAVGGRVEKPTEDRAAWEAAVHRLREQIKPGELGFGRTSLFRIAPRALIATDDDYRFAWQRRKDELLTRWRARPELRGYWQDEIPLGGETIERRVLFEAADISDADFCRLCGDIQTWVARYNEGRRREDRIPDDAIGLRSSENYTDPADAPRIATIYNGLVGRGQFLPFRKGDPEGSRWIDNEPLYIEWSHDNAVWMFENSGRREPNMPVIRNPHLYMTSGVTWTAVANHVALKARYQEPCVFDADSMRLTPMSGTIMPTAFLALLNSDVLSFFKMRFIQHTQKWEIGNLRQLPIVIPTPDQHTRLGELGRLAIECKRHEFAGTMPENALVARCRELAAELRAQAPAYLKPSAQEWLLATTRDCLAVIERTVNWESERLYGVEGMGPFDEF